MTGFDPNSIMQFAGYGIFILFMFYGTKIQLHQMLAQIGMKMKRIAFLRDESYRNLKTHLQKFINLDDEKTRRLQTLITSIAIPPVSHLDPAGIVPKMHSTFKTYDRYLKNNIRKIVGNLSQSDIENIENSLEVAIELDMFHRVIDHYYKAAKKGGVMFAYQLIMVLPMLMEMAEGLFAASGHFGTGLPIGDTFGPMVAAKFGGTEIGAPYGDSETIVKMSAFEDRKLITVKARGPGGSVGNPATSIEKIVADQKPSLVVTVDAALRLESEKTGEVAEGVGTAMGGNGTERFTIEEATVGIPVLTVVCKMNMKEAISAMPLSVLNQVEPVVERVKQLIRENSESGETVIVVGVGNTMGVA